MALYQLRASGTWNGAETWNFGLHGSSSASVAAVADSWAAALTEAWSGAGTPAGALQTYYPEEVVLGTATAAALSATTGQQLARADVDMNLPGTSVAEMLPPQCAVVVSLRSPVANRTGRGRFYLPAPAVNAVAAGLIAPAAQQDIVDAMTRLFASLDAAAFTPQLFSRSTFILTTLDTFNVGNVFDTQRRRRNQLQEVRISGTV